MKEIVLNTLYIIIKFVEEFETSLIDRYKLHDIPYNEAGQTFPRSGQVHSKNEIFGYRFHGSGCKVEIKNAVLEYGINPKAENKIKITPRDLMIFMKSYLKEKEIQEIISRDLHFIFNELEQEGVLRKQPESIASFEIVKKKLILDSNK